MNAFLINIWYFFFSIVYTVSLYFKPYSGSFLLKILPILCLFYWVLRVHVLNKKIFLLLALSACIVGDILLNINDGIENGLIAFLIGHLFYFIYFVQQKKGIYRKYSFVVILLFVVIVMNLKIYILDSTKAHLFIPILIYSIVISLMNISIFYVAVSFSQIIGGILFIISDFLIAVDIFIYHSVFLSYFVIVTYYCAQWLIVMSERKRVQVIE